MKYYVYIVYYSLLYLLKALWVSFKKIISFKEGINKAGGIAL